MNVQRAGVYGQCSEAGVLNFMRPTDRSTCSFMPKPLSKEFCEGDLALTNLFEL